MADAAQLTASLAPARGSLHAVLDSARSTRILTLLRESSEQHASLYEGAAGLAISAWGPFLVHVPHDSRLCLQLVREGWGQSWGIFVHSSASFERLRRHFRRFLMVETESGKRAYFRFYDPRVARVFLPIATPRQAATLFDEVDGYLMESEDRTVVAFRRQDR